MQLDYKILWVDDDESFIETNMSRVKTHIENYGFNPIIKHLNTLGDDTSDETRGYDIIFVDYMLSDGINGDDFIKSIRDRKIYTNIVFYSSDPEKIRTETAEKKLSGVYIFDREEFNSDEILNLVKFFLEKDMNEHTMRGIIMSEVARFDADIWELLKNKKMSGTKICKNCVSERVKGQKEKSWNTVKDLSVDNLWDLIEEKGTIILDSTQRSIVLHADMIGAQISCADEKGKLCDPYCALLKSRNDLAHKKDANFSDEQFLTLRKTILEFRDVFENIKSKLEEKDV